jgi:hypothetical protein
MLMRAAFPNKFSLHIPAPVRRGLSAALLALATSSCQTTPRESWQEPSTPSATAEKLAALHPPAALTPQIRREAEQLATTAHRFAAGAVDRYRISAPAWLHNVKVNMRIRDEGLCWHHMEDLFLELAALTPRHFELHCGVRDQGDLFREHHCVVVTATGAAFETGIVLDPWKKPGSLLAHRARGDGRPWMEDARHRAWLLHGRRLPQRRTITNPVQ